MWRENRRHAVHFGFALQNLSRGRRPIKSHSNVQKSASSFCTLAWLSALLMPNAQKEKPSAHSLCAKGECLAVPPFLMLVFLAYLRDLLTWIGREDLLQRSACRFKSYLPYLLSFRFLSACRESLSGGALVCTPLSHNLFLFSL